MSKDLRIDDDPVEMRYRILDYFAPDHSLEMLARIASGPDVSREATVAWEIGRAVWAASRMRVP